MSEASRSRSVSPAPGGQDAATPRVPAALITQARGRPDSWVYEVDPSADDGGAVCAAQIRRAWRTDATGGVVAQEYVDNPYYRPAPPPPRHRRRSALRVAAAGLALVIAAVVVLVLSGGSHTASVPPARARPASAPMPGAGAAARTQVRRAQARSALVPAPVARRSRPRMRPFIPRLALRASAPVWICLQDARGHLLVAGQTLASGQVLPALRGSVFHVFAGNGDFAMVVNGVTHRASGSPDPVAYLVSAGRVVALTTYPAQPCA